MVLFYKWLLQNVLYKYIFHIVGYENKTNVLKRNQNSKKDLGSKNVCKTSLSHQEKDPKETYPPNDIEIIQEDNSKHYFVTKAIPIQASLPKNCKRDTKKTRILKKVSTLDFRFIERFGSAWRCKICQKITSTKYVAMDHREEDHPVAMQLN